MKQGQASGGKS
jgi:hypothetical protein